MSVLRRSGARVLTCCGAAVLACCGALVLTSTAAEHGTGALGHQSTSAPSSSTGLIAGQVVDAGSAQPIAGVAVTLRGIGQVEARIDAGGSAAVVPKPQVVTDSLGRFVFPALGPGTYTLSTATRSGFGVASAQVELGRDERVTDVQMRLPRYGSIAGTVRDDAGDPVVGMQVGVFLKRDIGFRLILLPRGGAEADDRGRFWIGNLPPGEYLVCACGRASLPIDSRLLSLLGPTPPSAAAVAQRGDNTMPAFPSTFHPGTTRASLAMTVVIGSGEERAGIDISVYPVKPLRVSGQLTAAKLNAVEDLAVVLVPENDLPEMSGVTQIEPVSVTPAGAFEFVGVPPGRYSLEVYPTDSKAKQWASVTVTAGDENIRDLVVPLSSGATITGRIEFSGSAPRPSPDMLERSRVSLSPLDLSAGVLARIGTSGSVGHTITLERDGTFRLENLPPVRHMVAASGFGTAWTMIETIRTVDGTSTDPVVTLTDAGLSGVVITMSDTALASVQGTVVLDKYESPQQVRVLLFPADVSTWAEPLRAPSRFVLSPVTTRRTFKSTGIAAGDYFIALIPTDANTRPDGLEAWSQRATRITLKPGQTTTVELRR